VTAFPYIFRWNLMGRKGQLCRVVMRGTRNSRLVEFEDGHRAVTSGNALRKAPPPVWRIVSPAPRSAVLALAPAPARVRRLFFAQAIRFAESAAVMRGDEAIAIMMLGRHGWRRTEIAFAGSPAASAHIGRLIRMAQLTLLPLAQTRLIVAKVNPANRAGQRLASLTGFRPAKMKRRDLWILRS
jgi:hypothetical protein